MGIRRGISATRPAVARSAELPGNVGAAMAAVLFGASVVAVRVAVRDVPPISLAVLRIGQGGLLLAVILLVVAPDRMRVRWERLRLFALLGLVLFALFPLTFNIGLRYTEASRGAVMLATMPIWSALLGRVAGERLARRQVAGVGLSVVGIALAFVEPGRAIDADAMSLVGDGLLLLTGLLGAVYGLVAKRVLAVDSPATVTTYAMLFGALALLPAALVEGIVPAVGNLDRQVLGLIRVPRRAGWQRGLPAVDLGLVPPGSHPGCRLREPEPDRGGRAGDPAAGRTAQRPVRGRLRGRGRRRPAGQLAAARRRMRAGGVL
jgi:drug/metabolite transporter (DMT)-like permease